MNLHVHHAVLFEGDESSGIDAAEHYSTEVLGVHTHGNPDYSVLTLEQYTIEHARDLKSRASQTPLGNRQVFVLAFERITHAAQNALLKLLEEPGPDTYFILVVPSARLLLPTVRSRLALMPRILSTLDLTVGAAFLDLSPGDRVTHIAPLIKAGDRKQARMLCDALERELYTRNTDASRKALREVVFVRQYLSDSSSSLKMLLEHLSVVL